MLKRSLSFNKEIFKRDIELDWVASSPFRPCISVEFTAFQYSVELENIEIKEYLGVKWVNAQKQPSKVFYKEKTEVCNFIKKKTQRQVFSCEFWRYF